MGGLACSFVVLAFIMCVRKYRNSKRKRAKQEKWIIEMLKNRNE